MIENGESSEPIPPGMSGWSVLYQAFSLTKQLYLDTNVWSELAKGNYSTNQIRNWISTEKGYVILSRFQVVELCRAPHLAENIMQLAIDLEAVFVDRGQNEFTGAKRRDIKYDLFLPLRMPDAEAKKAFVEMIQSPDIKAARSKLDSDAIQFSMDLQSALDAVPPTRRRSWDQFDASLEKWLRGRCRYRNVDMHPEGLTDDERYAGIKLSYALLYFRYFLSSKIWESSDYVDYLHCSDMAYSDTVITERSLAGFLNDIKNRHPDFSPRQVHTLRWLSSSKE